MSAATYCYNHPQTETSLRCNNCDRYICTKCAVHTPTGYRCRECVRGHSKVFETAKPLDYVLGFVIALVLSFIAGLIATRLGFFVILLAPAAGSIIAEAVRAVTGRRRSPLLFRLTAAGVAIGGLWYALPVLLSLLSGGNTSFLLSLLWPAVYTLLATSAAYYRHAGIQMGRR
ncbi:MAG: hypothetical protein KIS85_03440 [Anaerolineales bacterium]|nr:hypothetical protein [Anaerolineales bacterium]